MNSLQEILREAEARGISDKDIAAITGKNYTTVWRWRKRPDTAFVFDAGIAKLVEKLEGTRP